MQADMTVSGLPGVGDVEWGAHVCQFYRTREDLVESLVPFFKAGIEHNEACLWVTAEPFRAVDARDALKSAVPDLDARIKGGQIQILDYEEWYVRNGGVGDVDGIIKGWLNRSEAALASGYNGLRLTGNLYRVEKEDWKSFVEYERKVNENFRNHRIVGLCSYCLTHCGNEEVFDVVRNHDFALLRRDGEWEQIESSSLKLAKEELRQLAETLELRVQERTAELETALNARDRFLSVASHELKTPVASIQLYLETLRRASERGEVSVQELPARIAKAQDQCRRLDHLIGNLLDVSRSKTNMSLELERSDLSIIAGECVGQLEDHFISDGCSVRVDAESPVLCEGDPLRLGQAITNLLTNVLRHAAGRPVDIRVTRAGAYAQVTVADQGPGISPDDQQRLFQRFIHTPLGRTHGSFGLGLWIVREIAEAHGGTVHVVSDLGRGASFTLSLPLRQQKVYE